MNRFESDILVVGCGLAGLYTALTIPEKYEVMIVSKGGIEDTNSFLAQGGIAAAIDSKRDSVEAHFEDTVKCGHYENDRVAVEILVQEAGKNILELEKNGVAFDKDEKGQYILALEGAHSFPRVLKKGDYTGKAIMEALYQNLLERKNIKHIENCTITSLMVDSGVCHGGYGFVDGEIAEFSAKRTIFATGGIGHLFTNTTNAEGIDGLGIAVALDAKAKLTNLTYMQFHPTAFYSSKNEFGRRFLLSESLRGEGAKLINEFGEEFMSKYDERGELAPRDVVSKSIISEIKKQKNKFVYLDITDKSKQFLEERFPTIYEYCLEEGLRMENDKIPVVPSMHYFMGGIEVDLDGNTSIKNLYAVGECANTGVHGKNRLASNSLLEAIVFGRRIADKIEISDETNKHLPLGGNREIHETAVSYEKLKLIMDESMGIERESGKIKKSYLMLEKLLDNPTENKEYNLESVSKLLKIKLIKEILSEAMEVYSDEENAN